MSKNDINDVLGVFGRVWGCLDSMDFFMLDEDVDVDVDEVAMLATTMTMATMLNKL